MFNSHCYSYVVYARKHGRDVKCPVSASGIRKLNIYNNMGGGLEKWVSHFDTTVSYPDALKKK